MTEGTALVVGSGSDIGAAVVPVNPAGWQPAGMEMVPIGRVASPRTEPLDDDWDSVTATVQTGARHPRDNPDWPAVGIFAQRAKGRPNRIGVSVCRLLAVDGLTLTVHALDAVDGSPVLDVKPYLAEFAPRGEVHQPAWSHELMSGYWRTAPR